MSTGGKLIKRRSSREVPVGDVVIGGGNPILVQTMTKVNPHDGELIAREADRLTDLGAKLVRLAIPDRRAAEAIAEVVKKSRAVIVADIHFDPRLALKAIESGVHKIRVNPGNLRGGEDAVRAIAEAARSRGVAIRVGANSGSLAELENAQDRGEVLAKAVLKEVEMFTRLGFRDIIMSAKGSDVPTTIAAGRAMARANDFPLHLGVTSAGPPALAGIKSAIGIGSLLADGIGDTIRVSYTGDSALEVAAGYEILSALGLGRVGVEIISCPTCGRTRTDMLSAVEKVRAALKDIHVPVKVAVMGCEVNGPGEAKEADIGLACGRGGGYLFKGGEKLERVTEANMVERLVALVNDFVGGKL